MEVWSWGAGTDGQLATASLADALLPQRVPALENRGVLEIACGGAHAVAVLGGREVLTWGRGSSGQLGHDDNETVSLPKLVESLHGIRIRSVAAGWSHTAFVSECGALYTCGDGAFGQLGLGDFKPRSLPSLVTSLGSAAVFMAACGMRHTLVLMIARESGETAVWAFGACKRGQLGVFPLTEDGGEAVDSWQAQAKEVGRACHPRRLTSLDEHNVAFVAANGDHSAALTDSGGLFLWGRGYNNHLDIPIPTRAQSDVFFDQIALGWSHGLGLSREHEVFSWGSNQRGQLGSQERLPGPARDTPSKGLANEGVTESDLHSQIEMTCPGFRKVHSSSAGVTSLAAGAEHSAAVLGSCAVVAWGWGEHGQLGLGTHNDQKIPQPLVLPTWREHTPCMIVCGSGFTFLVRGVSSSDNYRQQPRAAPPERFYCYRKPGLLKRRRDSVAGE